MIIDDEDMQRRVKSKKSFGDFRRAIAFIKRGDDYRRVLQGDRGGSLRQIGPPEH